MPLDPYLAKQPKPKSLNLPGPRATPNWNPQAYKPPVQTQRGTPQTPKATPNWNPDAYKPNTPRPVTPNNPQPTPNWNPNAYKPDNRNFNPNPKPKATPNWNPDAYQPPTSHQPNTPDLKPKSTPDWKPEAYRPPSETRPAGYSQKAKLKIAQPPRPVRISPTTGNPLPPLKLPDPRELSPPPPLNPPPSADPVLKRSPTKRGRLPDFADFDPPKKLDLAPNLKPKPLPTAPKPKGEPSRSSVKLSDLPELLDYFPNDETIRDLVGKNPCKKPKPLPKPAPPPPSSDPPPALAPQNFNFSNLSPGVTVWAWMSTTGIYKQTPKIFEDPIEFRPGLGGGAYFDYRLKALRKGDRIGGDYESNLHINTYDPEDEQGFPAEIFHTWYNNYAAILVVRSTQQGVGYTWLRTNEGFFSHTTAEEAAKWKLEYIIRIEYDPQPDTPNRPASLDGTRRRYYYDPFTYPNPSPSPTPSPTPTPTPTPAPTPSPSPTPTPTPTPSPSPTPSPTPTPTPSPTPTPTPTPEPDPDPDPDPDPLPDPNKDPDPPPDPDEDWEPPPDPTKDWEPTPYPYPYAPPVPDPYPYPQPLNLPNPGPFAPGAFNPSPFPNPFPMPSPLPPGIVLPPAPAGDACKRNANACSLAQNDKIDAVNQNVNNQNANLQNLYNFFNTILGLLADLYLLRVVNAKLGPQVLGGISGFLGRMLQRINKVADWLHLDRILNILTFVQTLHNAYMLSANLGQTLFSAISNGLAAIGIKDAEGNPLQISQILGGEVDNLFKGILGVTTWEGIKADWKKFNRIYQAAANLLWSIQSIGQSILNALEVVGGWVASIGNALRKFGAIGEKAFGWMNQSPNFDNKFFTGLESATNVISQVDSVASEVLSVQQTVVQIAEQKKELENALAEVTGAKQGTPPPEAAKQKEAGEAAKISSSGASISLEAQIKPGS